MGHFNKVIGIGMSKTGTSTLGKCFQQLGLTPHTTFNQKFKQMYLQGEDPKKIIDQVRHFRSFEDSPWYFLFREMDAAFPNSKFILTVRKDSVTHARSSWAHGVRLGEVLGEPPQAYIEEIVERYERHNAAVREYFKHRPENLLIVCWENGDGWDELCDFLGMNRPDVPFPHANKGRYKKTSNSLLRALQDSRLSMIVRRASSKVRQQAYRARAMLQRRTRELS